MFEKALHHELDKARWNKINRRKECFRCTFDKIVSLVEKYHGKVNYVAEPEVLEYYEIQNMTDEDYDFVAKKVALRSFTQPVAGSAPLR